MGGVRINRAKTDERSVAAFRLHCLPELLLKLVLYSCKYREFLSKPIALHFVWTQIYICIIALAAIYSLLFFFFTSASIVQLLLFVNTRH